ncbi:hypothetical protein SAMN05216338_105046 [Bradyrhizobium sp. Rc2d]|nr:hypothetical protein SAMN05216338_105046 [Bradyrhizobium sp. Rc2d]
MPLSRSGLQCSVTKSNISMSPGARIFLGLRERDPSVRPDLNRWVCAPEARYFISQWGLTGALSAALLLHCIRPFEATANHETARMVLASSAMFPLAPRKPYLQNVGRRTDFDEDGRAVVLPPGNDEFSMIPDWVRATNGPEYRVHHVVRIEATSISRLLSPAHVFADPPRSQEEIRDTYRRKYELISGP